MTDALNFILRTLTNRKAAVAEQPALIQKSSHTFEATVFYQSKKYRTKGTIIVANGFSVYGDKDERTLSVARNMASLGYTVVAPRFSMLNRLIIHPQLVSDIQNFILA
ncbi:MAG: hypothetical protein NZ522_05540, partial [Chitinophagales bacterium]|nr:hypothetical protein [Chitinophagales bacterium]